MPIEEEDAIRKAAVVSEYRKIKIGAKGKGDSKAPQRFKAPVVTHPRKGPGGSQFDVDEETMNAIRRSQGVKESKLDPKGRVMEQGGDVKAIPVRLLTDDIRDALVVYRGMYNASGRALCKSSLGDAKAQRYFSPNDPGSDKGRKIGKFFILNEPVQVDCNKLCRWWPKPGDKSECTWKLIMNVQLENSLAFPQPTRFRSQGWTVIRHLHGSLNKIAAVTSGVLANIPLLLAEIEIETFTANGEKRTHPVMEFQVPGGNIQALREAAIAELESRRRLKAALSGVPVTAVVLQPGEMTAGVMDVPVADEGDGVAPADLGDPDDWVDLEGAEEASPPAPAPAPAEDRAADALMAEVETLRRRANVSDRAFEAMCDKHKGDLAKVRDELSTLAGDNKTAAVGDDTDDWAMGEDSEEPSETMAEAQAATQEPEADVQPAAAMSTGAPAVDDDEFAIFDD